MAKTSTTTVRFDEVDRQAAASILDGLGLTLNGYLNMAIRQLINRRGVPFDLTLPEEVPNEETERAMVVALAKEYGLIPDDSVAFHDADEAVAYLESL